MNPEIKKLWVDALRSGDYAQGQGRLRSVSDKYCCLGVLCELAVQALVIEPPVVEDIHFDSYLYASHSAHLPSVVGVWAGLDGSSDVAQELMSLNDNGVGFPEIADQIEVEL